MVLTFSGIPEDIITRILKITCSEIINEITDLSLGYEPVDFGRGLRDDSRLCLVSTQFRTLLSKYVRVNSLPVRPHFIRLQVLEFSSILNHSREKVISLPKVGVPIRQYESWAWLKLNDREVETICGPIWHNPSFPKLFTHIFDHMD